MKTQENLLAAFAGESQANRKYLAFAKAAEKEGKMGIAKLFRVASEGETIHALKHLQNAGRVGTTEENLKAAIEGETDEFTNMYPQFIKDAETEDQKAALLGFKGASAVEEIHANLFKEALANDVADKDYYICPVCGYPHADEAPEKCPICGTPKENFYLLV